MGFFDAFITVKKDESTEPTASTPKATTAPITQIPATPAPAQSPSTIMLNGGVVDQKFVEFFRKVLSDANLPGPDYFEFRQAFDDTAEFQTSMTEPTRMKMVFKTMASSGLSKDVLINSANQYKQILENEKNEFSKTIEKKREVEITGREKSIENLTAENQKLGEQIASIQLAIQNNQTRMAEIRGEIATNGNAIEQSQINFSVTYNAFVNQIDMDIEKITTNL